jgi:hypothetical protein
MPLPKSDGSVVYLRGPPWRVLLCGVEVMKCGGVRCCGQEQSKERSTEVNNDIILSECKRRVTNMWRKSGT